MPPDRLGADSVDIQLNDVTIGKAYFNLRSVDFLPASPGTVDASDLGAIAQALACPNVAYPSACPLCFDVALSDSLVDASDIGVFAQHYPGHARPGYSKPLTEGGSIALSVDSVDGELITIEVSMQDVSAFAATAVVLEYAGNHISFDAWQEEELSGVQTFAVPVTDDDGTRLVLLFFGGENQEWNDETIGRITLRSTAAIDLEHDIEISRAEYVRPNGQVLGLRRAGKANEPPHIEAIRDTLQPNEPNPFNPSTTLRYAVARDGQISLRIYDVKGRLVRSLVDGPVSRSPCTQHALSTPKTVTRSNASAGTVCGRRSHRNA